VSDVLETAMISVDDHLIEPPDLWTTRLPSSMREHAPRVERSDAGGDQWVFEDQVVPLLGMTAVAGAGGAGYRDTISFADMRPSCYDAAARVADLDLDCIAASACFPTWVGFSGTRLSAARDKALGLACIQAYNDFVIDQWCAASPGRYIPVVLVPLWDQAAAADEAERTAAKGARAIAFSENPSQQGYPSIHDQERRWDRLFSVVSEAEMPLCLHIGSSSHIFHPPSPDSPVTVLYTTDYMNSQYTLIEWLLSDNFDRFPNLRLCLSEGGIGWVPHCVERCDFKWERYARWSNSPPKNMPSTYVRDHLSFCLMEDDFGAQQIDRIGIDNILVETDFPHADSHWPVSHRKIAERIEHLGASARAKVLRGNAEKLFRWTAPAVGAS
jgi:predicted TIM-barrel fold metal-dependent hydrolase